MTHLEGLSKVSYATLTSGGHFAHRQVCRLLRSTCKGSRRAASPALGPSPVFGPLSYVIMGSERCVPTRCALSLKSKEAH